MDYEPGLLSRLRPSCFLLKASENPSIEGCDSHVPPCKVLSEMEVCKYEIDVFWSDKDRTYVAIVPDLPCLSAHGLSYEEALEEIQVEMRFYLEMVEERGDPIPEPRARPTV